MNTNLSKRLEAVERTVDNTQGLAGLRTPLETLSAEDQALVTSQREARQNGEPASDAPEVHRAMRRHIRACAEFDEILIRAGAVVRPVGDTIRQRLDAMRRARGEAA